MTWLKLSDDYTDRMEFVSDAAFRLHTEALVAVMKRETGPWLSQSRLMRSTTVRDADRAIVELLECGFWRERDGGYELIEHMEHQPEPEVLAVRRSNNAKRQRTHRLKKAGLASDLEPS